MGLGLVSVRTGEQRAVLGVRRLSTSIPLLALVISSNKQNKCFYIISACNLWVICLERQTIGTIWFHCTSVNTRESTPVSYLRAFFLKEQNLKELEAIRLFWFCMQDLLFWDSWCLCVRSCTKEPDVITCGILLGKGPKWAGSSCFEQCSVHICTSWNGVACGLKPCWHFKHII